MTISRRNFLQKSACGALAGATICHRAAAYEPTLSRSAAEEAQPAGPLRLDNNENAYGPSQEAIQAIKESLPLASRYPDPEYGGLLESIANAHRVKTNQVVLGCGSSEILRAAAAAFLGPRKRLVIASPTFEFIADEARKLNAEVVAVPLTKKYAHNLDAMLARAGTSTGLIYICNPNNPTGTLTQRQDLDKFLRDLRPKVPVVIDEAYHHYVGSVSSSYASFLDRPVNDDRVIVTRTFSAIHGLAGLRVGYGVAAAPIARQLSTGCLQSGINVIATRAAAAALGSSEHVRACMERNANDRQEFLNMANARMVRVLDSQANFVMVRTGQQGQAVIEHFKKNNILLGPFVPAMPTCVRVSLGTLSEMKEFWRVWDLLPIHPMEM